MDLVASDLMPAVAEALMPSVPAVAEDLMPAVAADVQVPVCASKSDYRLGKWHGVALRTSSIVIEAGFCGRIPHVAQSIIYRMDGLDWRFVHVHKALRWFICAVAGPHAHKGDINAVQILDTIRDKFFGWDIAGDANAAVADGQLALADEEG